MYVGTPGTSLFDTLRSRGLGSKSSDGNPGVEILGGKPRPSLPQTDLRGAQNQQSGPPTWGTRTREKTGARWGKKTLTVSSTETDGDEDEGRLGGRSYVGLSRKILHAN